MAENIFIAGIDPSFRNWGMVKGSYSITCGTIEVLKAELNNSLPPKTGSKSKDDLLRAQNLCEQYTKFTRGYTDVIFIELPTGSQSARAAKLSGVCTGVLACRSMLTDCPLKLIYVTPNEVKKVTGLKNPNKHKKPNKHEMMDWAYQKHPGQFWIPFANGNILNKNGKLKNDNEHIADAIAVIYAGIQSSCFKEWLEENSM